MFTRVLHHLWLAGSLWILCIYISNMSIMRPFELIEQRMLGSRSLYRRLLSERKYFLENPTNPVNDESKLSVAGEGIAGMLAGWTVSFVAAPVEHVKARLQIQYSADKSSRLYSGPIDCSRKLVKLSELIYCYYA